MTAIMRQVEEMEQKEKAVKAGPCFTHLEGTVGRRSLKTRERKRPSTSRVASKAKAKRRLWRRESVPCPRKATRPKSNRMKKEWAVVAQAAKLRRKSAQSARTTAKKANVGNARDQARASIAES